MNRLNKTAYLAVGAAAGYAANDTEPAKDLLDAFIRVLDRHGLAVAISFVFVAASVTLVSYLLKQTMKSKDDEIKRLVRLRDELWDQYLKERPTSGASPNP